MAFNPMDMNNDGRVNYTDYSLHQMYINPSSPNYQGNNSSQITSRTVKTISFKNIGRNLAISLIFIVLCLAVSEILDIDNPIAFLFILGFEVFIFYCVLSANMAKIERKQLDTVTRLKIVKKKTMVWLVLLISCFALFIASSYFSSLQSRYMAEQINPYRDSLRWSEIKERLDQYNKYGMTSRVLLFTFVFLSADCLVGFLFRKGWQKEIEQEINSEVENEANETNANNNGRI